MISAWRPQSLLSACLRQAIIHLSNGQALNEVTARAVNYFLAVTKNPGLDVRGVDTYTLAMDYCAIIRNVLEYLSQLTLLSLREIPPVSLTSSLQWQFLSHRDESGTLHRWKFVDYINEDITDELHSWEVFGDIAAAEMPMELHLVAIGQRKQQHQHSPWCKVYTHPKLLNVFRFQKKSGDGLEGDWKPVWYNQNQNNPKQWVDLMISDNIVDNLIRHVSVTELPQEHLDLFMRDVLAEAETMEAVYKTEPKKLPMSRYACDNPYPCPHQLYCYTNATLDSAGIYEAKRV